MLYMTEGSLTLYIKGVTDEQTTCDRCGKEEIRCTVIVCDADGAEVGRYGTACVAKVIGFKVTAAEARTASRARIQRAEQTLRVLFRYSAPDDQIAAARDDLAFAKKLAA